MILTIAKDVLGGLQYLHRAGLAHRDLKASLSAHVSCTQPLTFSSWRRTAPDKHQVIALCRYMCDVWRAGLPVFLFEGCWLMGHCSGAAGGESVGGGGWPSAAGRLWRHSQAGACALQPGSAAPLRLQQQPQQHLGQ